MKSILPSSISTLRTRGVLAAGLTVAGAALVVGGFQGLRGPAGHAAAGDSEPGDGVPQRLTNSTVMSSAMMSSAGMDRADFSQEREAFGNWIEPLHASTGFGVIDADQDGLPDAYEQVLQSALDNRDTDADGFEDFEERSRGTNVHDATDIPTAPQDATLNLIAHATTHEILVGAAMYFGSGLGGRYKIRVGVSSGGRIALLPLQYLGQISEISDVSRVTVGTGPGYEPGAELRFMQVCLPRRLMDGERHLCVYAYLVDTVTAQIVASETIDLFSSTDGGIVAEEPIESMPPPTPIQSTPISGSLYIPLGGGNGPNDVPTTWSPLRVCLKSSTVVGTSGSLVTREVVRASCVAGYDGFCPSTCPSSVGSTYQTIDPLSFVSE